MKKIDMHCHILPGIDDGSANPKETLAMLRMALNQDFVGMIVTPHGSVRNASVERVQEIRTLCKKFRIQAYQRLGVRLPVFPGQENYVFGRYKTVTKGRKASDAGRQQICIIGIPPWGQLTLRYSAQCARCRWQVMSQFWHM